MLIVEYFIFELDRGIFKKNTSLISYVYIFLSFEINKLLSKSN